MNKCRQGGDVILQLVSLIDHRLGKHSISFDLLPYWGSNLSAFTEHPRLKRFSSQMFFSTVARIIDEFGPFHWQKQDGPSNAWPSFTEYTKNPDHLNDREIFKFL